MFRPSGDADEDARRGTLNAGATLSAAPAVDGGGPGMQAALTCCQGSKPNGDPCTERVESGTYVCLCRRRLHSGSCGPVDDEGIILCRRCAPADGAVAAPADRAASTVPPALSYCQGSKPSGEHCLERVKNRMHPCKHCGVFLHSGICGTVDEDDMILCRTCEPRHPAAHAGAPAAGAVAAAAVGAAVGAVAAAAVGGWALQLMLFLYPLAFKYESTTNDCVRKLSEVKNFVTRDLRDCFITGMSIQSVVLNLQTSLRDLHVGGQSDHDLQVAFDRCIMTNPGTQYACSGCGDPPNRVFALWDESVVIHRLVVSTDRFGLQGALGEHVLCMTCMQARYIVLRGTCGILECSQFQVSTAVLNVSIGYRISCILSVGPEGDFATSFVCDGIGSCFVNDNSGDASDDESAQTPRQTWGWFTFMFGEMSCDPDFEAVCLHHQNRKVRAILCEKVSAFEAYGGGDVGATAS